MSDSKDKKFYESYDAGPEWGTPEYIWKPLSKSVDAFNLDPASGCELQPIAEDKYTVVDDGLKQDWYGDVWVNPPYRRSFNKPWSEKFIEETKNPNVDSITALIAISGSAEWYHNYLNHGDLFTTLDHRVAFVGENERKGEGKKSNATFSSLIVSYFNYDIPVDYIKELKNLGTILRSPINEN